jgi:hypothetical protein
VWWRVPEAILVGRNDLQEASAHADQDGRSNGIELKVKINVSEIYRYIASQTPKYIQPNNPKPLPLSSSW